MLPYYTFPHFIVDKDIIYAEYGGRIITMDCINYEKIGINGVLEVEEDSSRDILNKYNDILFTLRKQEKMVDEQKYYYTYFELISVSDLSNPFVIGKLEIRRSTDYRVGYLSSWELINCHGYYVSSNAIYYFISSRCFKYEFDGALTEINDHPFSDGELYQHFKKEHLYKIIGNKIFIPTTNENSTKGFVIYTFTGYNSFVKDGEWFGEMNISDIYSCACDSNYFFLRAAYNQFEIFNIEDTKNPYRVDFLDLSNMSYVYFKHGYFFSVTWEELNIYNWSNLNNLILLDSYTYNEGGELANFLTDENEGINTNKITENRIYLPRGTYDDEMTTLIILNWSTPTNLETLTITGLPLRKITGLITTTPIVGLLIFAVTFVSFLRIKKKKRELRGN